GPAGGRRRGRSCGHGGRSRRARRRDRRRRGHGRRGGGSRGGRGRLRHPFRRLTGAPSIRPPRRPGPVHLLLPAVPRQVPRPRTRRCEDEVMPWVELEGAANVRDLGGLATQDGGETVGGRLLRGDNLQELSPSDVARLVGNIGLTTVVDLRSTAELVSEGPAPLDAIAVVRHAHHPILPEQGSATDVVADVLLVQDRDEQDRSRYPADPLCGHYLGYLEDRPDQVVAALRSVAAANGAALVHCAAGKDRTGVVVALTLTAVGVRPQDVVADYAATGEGVDGIGGRLRRAPNLPGGMK